MNEGGNSKKEKSKDLPTKFTSSLVIIDQQRIEHAFTSFFFYKQLMKTEMHGKRKKKTNRHVLQVYGAITWNACIYMVDKRNSTRKNQSRCSRTAVLLTWNK
jgi:Cys-tRNA synthase (O-phospho-L-seryl-tRNA:Cys-tRNA synthase)